MARLNSLLYSSLLLLLLTTSSNAITIAEVLGDKYIEMLNDGKSNEEIEKKAKEVYKHLLSTGLSDYDIKLKASPFIKNQDIVEDIKLIEVCVTTNLKSDAGKKILNLCMAVPKSKYILKIKNDLIYVYSSKTLEEIISKRGKQKANYEFRQRANIKTAYYTKFLY